jgi:glycosyltransferase involved in cell wall biosynthesis
MNTGLLAAQAPTVIFLDDDIVPDPALVRAHLEGQREAALVAGQVLQPAQAPLPLASGEAFRFNSTEPAWISEFMGGNFSVDRALALALGGFDENFVGAAFRFEAEFAHRYVLAHGLIRYEPRATIRHLALPTGGTRAHGHHLRTSLPRHSVGAYYFLLKTRPAGWRRQMLWRPIRAVRTRHHLRRPWWIPAALVAELRGFLLALRLLRSGERLIEKPEEA